MNNKTGVFFIYLNLRHILQNVIIVVKYLKHNAIQLSIISVVFCHREPLFFMPKNFKNITKNS